MLYTIAQFWADTITRLLAGHKVIIIDARQWQCWQPDSVVTTLKDAEAFPHTHAPGTGFFHITSSYGVHDGLDNISIVPNTREIVMRSETAAGGAPCWRIVRDLEPDSDYHAWVAVGRAYWQLPRPS